ncbi:MAG: hypothetical protein IID08_06115 [Candidatus Hydrogenedentes bacterium]|nr:hypothetical protein [Candidatus Hydrogenedentota bacterium]
MVIKRIYCYFLCSFVLWVPILASQFVAAASDVTTQEKIVWLDNYSRALDEARVTGKPILIAFRCVP